MVSLRNLLSFGSVSRYKSDTPLELKAGDTDMIAARNTFPIEPQGKSR